MTITSAVWNRYLAKLRAINDAAANQMLAWLQKQPTPYTEETEQAMVEYALALASKYGAASAALSAEMYDAVAELSGMILPSALPAQTATIDEVYSAVYGTAKTENPETIAGAVGRLVKMAGVDTTMQNALRDGAEWAWIPVGDTCAFCLTLAANGWQRASRNALKNGHAEHIHANCDCTYAIRFDSSSKVAGYDPEKYKDLYDDAEGTKPNDKINAIRRQLYAENREEIREQQASAYEKRRELNSPAAEEARV